MTFLKFFFVPASCKADRLAGFGEFRSRQPGGCFADDAEILIISMVQQWDG